MAGWRLVLKVLGNSAIALTSFCHAFWYGLLWFVLDYIWFCLGSVGLNWIEFSLV